MKIEKLTATINGIKIDATLSDGVNFLFYKNDSEKNFYKKALEFAFNEIDISDEFYENNDMQVRIEINDRKVVYTLEYDNMEFYGVRALSENLFIEGKIAPVYYHEIYNGLIKSYLKKNGYYRIFDCCQEYSNPCEPNYLSDIVEKKNEELNKSEMTALYDYIKNIKPVFVNKKKTARLMLLANGEFFIEREDEEDDEQFVLAEYFKFAIMAQISDISEKFNFDAYGYPLFVCELFEMAGDSADIITILEVLKGYQGQTIFLCPYRMEKLLKEEKIVSLIEEIKEMILQF